MSRARLGLVSSAALLSAVLALGACGSDDEPSSTAPADSPVAAEDETATTSTSSTTQDGTTTEAEDSPTSADEEAAAGETADLPICAEAPPPCRDIETGQVIVPENLDEGSTGGAGYGGGAPQTDGQNPHEQVATGEGAEVPLCAESPPPCIQPSGVIVR